MNKNKFDMFLKELQELENKYGISISAGYEEEIDYTWDEEPYVSRVQAHLIFTDSDGNEITENER